jgi:hypothetical protein
VIESESSKPIVAQPQLIKNLSNKFEEEACPLKYEFHFLPCLYLPPPVLCNSVVS